MSANNFSKYINYEVKVLEKYSCINNCDSKARKNQLQMLKLLIKNFLKENKSDVKLYFSKNNKSD